VKVVEKLVEWLRRGGVDISSVARKWFPSKKLFEIYVGSRDGMNAASFHSKCDGRGPTFVVITGQSPDHPVCVFGGYATRPWTSHAAGEYVDAPGSFVFTLTNVYGTGAIRMDIQPGLHASQAMYCDAACGPSFGFSTIRVCSLCGPTATFDDNSYTLPGSEDTFGDPLNRNATLFTGAMYFSPMEIHVFSVVPV
jgi:hypothetical protein